MIKLNQLTTAEAMSHPDVVATVNALGKMCDELRTQNQALREALKNLQRSYVNLMGSGRDRIVSLGGTCDPVDVMEAADPNLRESRTALAEGGV